MSSNNALNQNSPNFTVNQITINNAPVVGTDGTNKDYVDMIASGFNFKNSCFAGTTGALTATYANGVAGVGATLTNAGAMAAFSVDGTSPALNARILVKNQASSFQNGIYTLTVVGSGAINWVLTRATDYDQASEIHPGDIVPVDNGTVNATTLWLQTATVAVIGTDAITFSQFFAGGINTINGNSGSVTPSSGVVTISGGNNITTTGSGSTLSVAVTGTTNHNVQIGNSSGSLTSVAPSATAGVPLISQGAAADPVFGTAVVAGGGTGDTSFTAYAVICGGTTSTGALQSIAGVGSSGNVLTSNGAGALPTFQAPAASSISITGNSGGALTGNSFTFTGGTTGLTFAGAGTTLTLGGTLAIANGGTNATSFATTDGTVYYDGTRLVTTATGTSGQILTSNGAGVAPTYQTFGSLTTAFNSIVIQIFTASGTYTPTSGMKYCIVEAQGSGGGGAGIPTPGASQVAAGGGGGAGGYARVYLTAAAVGSSQTVTIGAGGTGGSAGVNNGGSGNTTSLGTLCVAGGGNGGVSTNAGTSTQAGGGAGGAGSTGTLQTTGGDGESGMAIFASVSAAKAGNGGASHFGGGGKGPAAINNSAAGSAGVAYGSGGGGAVAAASQTQQAGGNGAGGVVIVTEFIH